MVPQVVARGLRKSYGAAAVLRGVDLEVGGGTIFALLGPNGAGKTTAVRILATLLRADAGSATVAGFDVATQARRVRRAISLTGQLAAVDDLQTGAETLVMMGRLWGLAAAAARRRAADLLERFDLAGAGSRRVATYSGGMRRRLDLAASLVGTPAVLFLDEPTTGLDLRSRQSLWAAVREVARQGTTVLLTTQYLEEADRLADRVAVIDGGRVVAEGTPGALKARVGAERLRVGFDDPAAFQDALARAGGRLASADAAALVLEMQTDGTAADARALLDALDPARLHVTRFEVRQPTLDDVFLVVTGGQPRA